VSGRWPRLRRLIGPLGVPFYRWAVARRNRAFDRGRGVRRVGVPVISVGNLTTGGTGKTPMVAWLVERLDAALERAGHPGRCAVALRGYRADAHGRSDEAEEYRRRLPATLLLVSPDRAAAIEAALDRTAREGQAPPACVVLDDGFQHRRLARDLDIVLLDATRDPRGQRLLPAGDLREPVEALARAQAAVVTRAGEAGPEVVESLERWAAGVLGGSGVVAVCEQAAGDCRVYDASGAEAGIMTPEQVRAAHPVRVLVAGLGNPGPFVRQWTRGARGAVPVLFEDHHRYTRASLARIAGAVLRARAAGAPVIVTTGKDWVKLAEVLRTATPVGGAGALAGVPVIVPRVIVRFRRGEEALLRRAMGVIPAAGGVSLPSPA
jgi:tetraacyldisaccharide 4'-kinase